MFLGGIALTDQVLGLALNGLGLALLGILGYALRQLFSVGKRTFDKVEHLDECMDRTQKAVGNLVGETADLRQQLADERGQRLALEGYLRGLHNMPIDAPLAALKPGETG